MKREERETSHVRNVESTHVNALICSNGLDICELFSANKWPRKSFPFSFSCAPTKSSFIPAILSAVFAEYLPRKSLAAQRTSSRGRSLASRYSAAEELHSAPLFDKQTVFHFHGLLRPPSVRSSADSLLAIFVKTVHSVMDDSKKSLRFPRPARLFSLGPLINSFP